MRPSSLMATQVAAAVIALLTSGCPGDRPTDETPDGALRLFLEAMDQGDRNGAYELLAPETRHELERRAAEASRQAHHQLEPAEMIAVERYAVRWEISRLTPAEHGDRAVVTVTRSEESQRAEVELRREDGHWRVILPLGDAPPRAESRPGS